MRKQSRKLLALRLVVQKRQGGSSGGSRTCGCSTSRNPNFWSGISAKSRSEQGSVHCADDAAPCPSKVPARSESGAERASLPPHAPDILAVRIQAIDGARTCSLLDSQHSRLLPLLSEPTRSSPSDEDFYFRAFDGLVTRSAAGYDCRGNWASSPGRILTYWNTNLAWLEPEARSK